jgi:hypothetical protein
MSLCVPRILLLTALLSGCAKSAAPASPAEGYGYVYKDAPLVDSEEMQANLQPACARAPCPLKTPPGRVRVDLCGDCPAPYVCYLNPLVDVRRLPGADPRPRDFFECSKPLEAGLDAGLDAEVVKLAAPAQLRSCPANRQRYWIRNGARFSCCLFDEAAAVECHAE